MSKLTNEQAILDYMKEEFEKELVKIQDKLAEKYEDELRKRMEDISHSLLSKVIEFTSVTVQQSPIDLSTNIIIHFPKVLFKK